MASGTWNWLAPLVAPHAEDLGLQGAAQALRQAASGAADYNLAMQGCSAHEMPLPSSASVKGSAGRLQRDTMVERLKDCGPCHTVLCRSYPSSSAIVRRCSGESRTQLTDGTKAASRSPDRMVPVKMEDCLLRLLQAVRNSKHPGRRPTRARNLARSPG